MKSEYVGISSAENIYAEKTLLQTQLEILELMKGYQEYGKARKEGFVLKVALKSKIGEILDALREMEKVLPRVEHKKTEKEEVVEKAEEKDITLEEEIEKIRKKLEELS